MFLEFAFWFTNCVRITGDDSVVLFTDLLNSFADFTGDAISICLLIDYLTIYNIEVTGKAAVGVTLYD
ncbi:MAG: hypothetical protein EKK57_07885 [Proteobacteria bacterium]|nr:MAG: hypothetical protein EKK57_07885 [Pseudomonadota bacterium]